MRVQGGVEAYKVLVIRTSKVTVKEMAAASNLRRAAPKRHTACLRFDLNATRHAWIAIHRDVEALQSRTCVFLVTNETLRIGNKLGTRTHLRYDVNCLDYCCTNHKTLLH